MFLSTPALILLVANLGLIWLLLAAPIGKRTIRVRRLFREKPERIGEAMHPLGRDALWDPQILSSRPLKERDGIVQTFAQSDRDGQPIERRLALDPVDGAWTMAYEARVLEDSALDPAFWKNYRECRKVRPVPGGTELIIEQTDQYRGLAMLIFRFFQLRRQFDTFEAWLTTGKASRVTGFERPAIQIMMAVLSTLILWPFFGLSLSGLAMSTMLTLVIALHELGHLVAYRAFGHETVRMIFIPLLGGVAIGGKPYSSRLEVATCALMGPGLSAFFVPVLVEAHVIGTDAGASGAYNEMVLTFLLIMGGFNILNMLPMSRFDGGQVLRQVFLSRNALLFGTFVVAGAIMLTGWRIGIPYQALCGGLAVMVLLSMTNQVGVKPRRELLPIGGGERLFVLFGYYAALVIHAYGLIYAADHLF